MEKTRIMTREEIGKELGKLEAFYDAAMEYIKWRLEAIKPVVKEFHRRERQAKKARIKKPRKT